MPRYLLTNAVIVTGASSFEGSLGIDGERIAGIWPFTPADFTDAEVVDLGGRVLMAGGIDPHVHFREPGLTRKGDISSESLAALEGGVTSFIDMPNTIPPAVTLEAVEEKISRAESSSFANSGFHLGATNDNAGLIEEYLSAGLGTRFAGIKVFMGSSTGNMLVDRESALEAIFRTKGKTVLVHSEDEAVIRANFEAAVNKYGDAIPFGLHPSIRSREACIESTSRAIGLAARFGTALHILHVSTAEEVEMIRGAKSRGLGITAETSANYLWFCDEDYGRLAGRMKCNPSIKSRADREALRQALSDGTIDAVGSDHAPHLLSEKERPYTKCPSGIPSVRQSLPVLLTVAGECGIPLTRVASVFSERNAEIFGIKDRGFLKPGFFADLVVIDPDRENVVSDRYRCGWNPYEGTALKGSVEMVWLNGTLSVKDGKPCKGKPGCRRLEFRSTIKE